MMSELVTMSTRPGIFGAENASAISKVAYGPGCSMRSTQRLTWCPMQCPPMVKGPVLPRSSSAILLSPEI
jgi:hypothetical protein